LRELRQSPRPQSSLSHDAIRRTPLSGGAEISVPALRCAALRCDARRYRLRIVADSLGEPEPLKMQHFGGVYEKFQD
jgi:hypothetical protein